MAFVPDQTQPTKFVPDAPPVAPTATASTAIGPGDVIKGIGDAALSGADKLSAGVVGAPVGLANRLIATLSAALGGASNQEAGNQGQIAADAAHEYVNRTLGRDTQTPVGKKIGAAVQSMLAPVGESISGLSQLAEKGGEKIGIPAGATHGVLGEAGDIAGTAGLVAPVAAGATASREAADLAAQNAPSWAKRGFLSAADHPIAAGAAGGSGKEALTLQNQQVGNIVTGAEAGVPHGTPLTADTLAAGRKAPGTVYDRIGAGLPTGPLSPNAAAQVDAAGSNGERITQGSPNAVMQINALKSRLLDPTGQFTGQQVVNESRGLRQEGGTNIASEDVSNQQLGKAQLQMANALETHIADMLPPNANVSLDQYQAARQAMAKNYAVQGALKGQNVDMHALARIQNADPNLLTDGLKDTADFANAHPAVSGLGSKVEVPPSWQRDLGESLRSGGAPQDIVGRLFGASGISAGARRFLTGPSGSAEKIAGGTPVTGLADEFAPLNNNGPPQSPQAPTSTPTQGGASGGLVSLLDDLAAPAAQGTAPKAKAKKPGLGDEFQ